MPIVNDLIQSGNPVFAEICAGCAILSKVMQSTCFSVIPVDYDRNPHKLHLPTVKLNLSDPLQAAVLLDLAESGTLAVLWVAVPCGTCSRAREIPLPGCLLHRCHCGQSSSLMVYLICQDKT